MVEIPRYDEYSLIELVQALNTIRGDLYPQVYEALVTEWRSRDADSAAELETCYFELDREKHPEHAERLLARIWELREQQPAKEEVIDEGRIPIRYRTFWRRFWAAFLDAFVVGIPVGLVIFGVDRAASLSPAASAFTDLVAQLVTVAYFVIMHARYGRTVGKMATGVRIFDKSEASGLTWKQAVLRDIVPVVFVCLSAVYTLYYLQTASEVTLTGIFGLIVFATLYAEIAWYVAEFVTMLFSSKRRAVHDFIAGTVVVRVD